MLEIYFTRPRGFSIASLLLKKIQGVPFSHVAIRAGSYVYEAKWPFSKRSTVEEFKKKNIIVHAKAISFDKNEGPRIRKFLDSHLGKFYSPMQLVAIFGDIIKWPFLNRSAADNGYARLICTELVYLFYQEFMSGEYPEDSDMVDLVEIYTIVVLDKRVWKGKELNGFSNYIR